VTNPDRRLQELGLEPPSFPPLPFTPKLVPVFENGGLAYLSGVGPVGVAEGIVGDDLTTDVGYEAARYTGLLALRRLLDAFGELDRVDRWVRVLGFVRSAPGFADQPTVLNGFTDLVVSVYGEERGLCARSAIGVNALPAGIPVEVEAVVAVRR
jgi:enamine deaminase RidA (YjgF/YER057c/UK114 family)